MSDIILETRDLKKQFKGFSAVDGVSVKVQRGTIHALIGPNGAGKTTVFNLITRFLSPTSGSVFYEGADITRAVASEVACRGMVRSFQISAVFPQLSVRENVRLALQRKVGNPYSFWTPRARLVALDPRIDELLEAVGIAGYAEEQTSTLPYGAKRALELATTLALDPKLLLLDEPMAGLAHEDVGRISDLIRRIAANRTVLMVEHNLSVVADLSDRITVLTRGRVLAEGNYAEVTSNRDVRDAYIGADHE
ncbi:MAG: ABC transporter ATP-binding protein [Hyphomicrobiaceae bacterium]